MNTVENQKIIIVMKEKNDKGNVYSIINMDAKRDAWRKLDGNSYKVWDYIASNQDGYTFGLSRKAVTSDTNISDSTYARAIKKLKDNGFLIPKEGTKNTFLFYEKSRTDLIKPDKDDIICEIPEEKRQQQKEFVF